MSEQGSIGLLLVDRVYQSLSRQLRCGNPVFTSLSYCPSSTETNHLTDDDLGFVAGNVGARLEGVTVSYNDGRFIGTMSNKVTP